VFRFHFSPAAIVAVPFLIPNPVSFILFFSRRSFTSHQVFPTRLVVKEVEQKGARKEIPHHDPLASICQSDQIHGAGRRVANERSATGIIPDHQRNHGAIAVSLAYVCVSVCPSFCNATPDQSGDWSSIIIVKPIAFWRCRTIAKTFRADYPALTKMQQGLRSGPNE
jgi:hypothetical protein